MTAKLGKVSRERWSRGFGDRLTSGWRAGTETQTDMAAVFDEHLRDDGDDD